MSRCGALLAFVGLIPVSSLICGCPELNSAALSEALDSEFLVGGNDDRIVLSRFNYPDLPPFSIIDFITNPQGTLDALDDFGNSQVAGPTTELVVVDLPSLTVTPLTDLQDFESSWAVSDGEWLAWDEFDAFHAMNLITGDTRTVPLDLYDVAYLESVNDGRLLLNVYRGDTTILILVDLATGEEVYLTANFAGGGYALAGDQIAMNYYPARPGFDGDPVMLDGASLTGVRDSTIEILDLAGGAPQTVAAGLREATVYGFLNQTLVWGDLSADGRTETIRTYDTATGGSAMLLQLTSDFDAGSGSSISGVGDGGVIVHHSTYTNDGSISREVWELHKLDGSMREILTYEQSDDPFSFSTIYPWPRFVGGNIVYQDPDSGEWIVFDPAAGTRRTFQPFA